LAPHQNYKYVLTCVDHFSKFKWCFLIPNKEPKTILERLEIVFSTFTKPDVFQSDNGTEFKNSLIKNYCENKKIKFINGGVRHPQSQGVVEKINDFIAKTLKASFQEYMIEKKMEQNETTEKKCWGIETALMMFVANQNSKMHTVTNFIPNELVNYRDRNNKDHLKIINQVKERIYSYYAPKDPNSTKTKKRKLKPKNKLPNLEIGDKVFIVGNVKKAENDNKIIEDIPKKKTEIERDLYKRKICATVVDISHLKNDHIKVKVIGRPQNKSIQTNEIYDIHLKNVEITNQDSWNSNLD